MTRLPLLSVSVLALGVAFAAPAFAGFEFVAPSAKPAPTAIAAEDDIVEDAAAIPVAPVDSIPLGEPQPLQLPAHARAQAVAPAPAPVAVKQIEELPAPVALVPTAKPAAPKPAPTPAPAPAVAWDAPETAAKGPSAPVPVLEKSIEVDDSAPLALAPAPVPLTPVISDSEALAVENTPFETIPDAMPSNEASRRAAAALIDEPGQELPALSSDQGKVVEGFGRNVPLAIALQQIVPPSYRYSFEPPVSPSTRVVWEGGKPWKSIVADIARRNNMNVDITSNVVSFHQGGAPALAPVPTASFEEAAPPAPAPRSYISPAIPDEVLAPIPDAQQDELPPIEPIEPIATPSVPQPVAPISGDNELHSMLYDNIPAARTAKIAPAPIAPTPKTATAPKTSTTRTALASVSDTPLDAPFETASSGQDEMISPLPPASAPITVIEPAPAAVAKKAAAKKTPEKKTETAEASQKSAFFDSLMDSDEAPANKEVKEKKILTEGDSPEVDIAVASNNIAPAASSSYGSQQPLDILDKVETPAPRRVADKDKTLDVAPVAAATSVQDPIIPAPAATPSFQATDFTKSIDNPPVASAELGQTGKAPAAPKADMTTPQEWEAKKTQTLRQALTVWSESAGVSLVWSSEYDYPLQTDVRINSGYADAVRTLLAGFSKAQPRPIGRLFNNAKVGAQPVLIVETQRLTN